MTAVKTSLWVRLWRPVRLTAVLALLWWALTGDQALVFGAVVIALTVILTVAATPPRLGGWRPWRLPVFAGYFLYQSLIAGYDVARRAFSPRLPLAPGWLEYQFTLPAGTARNLFINSISLLPGTVSGEFDHRSVQVHLLVETSDPLPGLIALERQIAALFGLPSP